MLYKLLSIFLYIIVLTKKSFLAMNDRISKIRKVHSVASILLFIVLICFCDYTCKDLKLSQISLSKFGIDENIGYIWNSTLFILSILLYIDDIKNVNKFFHKNRYKKALKILFAFSNICLLLTAAINMNYNIHNITAFLYFLGYSISIYIFGHQTMKEDLRIGALSVGVALCSVFFPTLIFYMQKTLAIPEIIHCVFIFIWILFMSFETETKNILKKFGL